MHCLFLWNFESLRKQNLQDAVDLHLILFQACLTDSESTSLDMEDACAAAAGERTGYSMTPGPPLFNRAGRQRLHTTSWQSADVFDVVTVPATPPGSILAMVGRADCKGS